LSGSTSLDEIEVACGLIEPPAGSRPHLAVALSLKDSSPGRQREIYPPIECSFFFLREDGGASVIGSGTDLIVYPAGLTDLTIPRLQPITFSKGIELSPGIIGAISTVARLKNTVLFEVRVLAALLNNVRTVNQRMIAFSPIFRFTLDIETWNTWLSRWQERYISSDLPKTVPQEIAADYAEGVRCLNVEAFRASVVMFRRSLESAAVERGGTGRDLLSALQSLVERRILSKANHALATGVRMFGNYGAHPSTDQLSSVSRDDAELVLQVTRQLLKKMFET
jgi:hypothetical protein